MTIDTQTCPDCGSSLQRRIGAIPSASRFAGRQLTAALPGGSLFQCVDCDLFYRWPQLDLRELNELYVAGEENNWTSTHGRRKDWQIAREWLSEHLPQGGRVLDVGCFDGGFLDSLGASHERFGIEIHPAARISAASKGIALVASEFGSLARLDLQLDCVTAFDVIEHVRQPTAFLQNCADRVKPGGLVVVATGNAQAASFRLMRGAYWYTAIPEHISFISRRWFDRVTPKIGLRLIASQRFSHAASRRMLLLHCMANLTYRYAPAIHRVLLRLRDAARGTSGRDGDQLAPPNWITAQDHFITLLEKPR